MFAKMKRMFLVDRGRCQRTISEVWKIQLKTEFVKYIKSEDPKDPRILYIWQTLSEAYIFHAEDNVRGRRPLYFIYPVSLNVVLEVMLQIHFYICMKEQLVDLFKHMLKLRMSEFPLFHFYFIFLFFIFCYFLLFFFKHMKLETIYIYIVSAHKIGHYLYLYSVCS